MNREHRALLALVLGAVTLRLVVTGRFGWFVHQRMRLPLLAAAAVLIVIGLFEVWRPSAAEPADQDVDADDSDDHSRHGSRVGWLLAAPVIVLVGVSPTALGAGASDRFARSDPVPVTSNLAPLDLSGTPDLTLIKFLTYAADDSAQLTGRQVTLTGFVVGDDEFAPDGFMLTRFMIGCCAADAFRLQVAVRDAPGTWVDDTWVSVTGEWIAPPGGAYPTDTAYAIELKPTSITPISEPDSPYESVW